MRDEDEELFEILRAVVQLRGFKDQPNVQYAEAAKLLPFVGKVLDDQVQFRIGQEIAQRAFDSVTHGLQTRRAERPPNKVYIVEIFGETYTFQRQKDVFLTVLQKLSQKYPTLLDRMILEQETLGSRRVIWRQHSGLAETSGDDLGNGYQVNTRMEKEAKLRVIKDACRLAGVEFGKSTGVKASF